MLLANSLIIGALAISPDALWEDEWTALAILSAGRLISAAWAGITVLAWSAIRRHVDLAGTFASTCFKHLPNPFAETICNRAHTGMHHLVLLVIAVFVLMYLGLAFIRLSWNVIGLAASPRFEVCMAELGVRYLSTSRISTEKSANPRRSMIATPGVNADVRVPLVPGLSDLALSHR